MRDRTGRLIGYLDQPLCDAISHALLADLSPPDPAWRYGAVFGHDRRARELRQENLRRHEDWLDRATLSSTGGRSA